MYMATLTSLAMSLIVNTLAMGSHGINCVQDLQDVQEVRPFYGQAFLAPLVGANFNLSN